MSGSVAPAQILPFAPGVRMNLSPCIASVILVLCGSLPGTSFAQSDTATVPITVLVQPIAQIQFPSGANLHLTVPPSTSTLPNDGVLFTVTGNATASVSAAPDAYLFVDPYVLGNNTFPGRFLGKATHVDGHVIGYNLAVEFPVFSSPKTLPGTNGGSSPAASADVSGGAVQGFLHLLASHRWTPNGTMPAVGDYLGSIVVTVTASL